MADQALTKHTPIGSFLIHIESEIVCLESGFLIAPASPAVDLDMVGYPVKGDAANGFTLCLEADSAAGITGWIVENGVLNLEAAATTDRKFAILARGPAAVNGGAFPVDDIAGTEFTAANLIAAAEGANIQVRNESPKTSTQVN